MGGTTCATAKQEHSVPQSLLLETTGLDAGSSVLRTRWYRTHFLNVLTPYLRRLFSNNDESTPQSQGGRLLEHFEIELSFLPSIDLAAGNIKLIYNRASSIHFVQLNRDNNACNSITCCPLPAFRHSITCAGTITSARNTPAFIQITWTNNHHAQNPRHCLGFHLSASCSVEDKGICYCFQSPFPSCSFLSL